MKLPIYILAVLATIASIAGCAACLGGDTRGVLFITGQIVDATTGEAVAPVHIIGTIRQAGEQTGMEGAILDDRPNLPVRVVDVGDFFFVFVTDLTPICSGPLGPRIPPPEFPRPDQIELTIALEGCEQTVVIDINETTVIDPTAPDDILEFRNPIPVPPCEGDGDAPP